MLDRVLGYPALKIPLMDEAVVLPRQEARGQAGSTSPTTVPPASRSNDTALHGILDLGVGSATLKLSLLKHTISK